MSGLVETIKAQNWVAIIIESLVVVLGVFVALQVSNWNDNLKAQRDSFEILDRLLDEVEVNIAAATESNEKISVGADARARARRAIKSCDPGRPAEDIVNEAINGMVSDIVPGFVDSTANELSRSNQYFKYLTPDFRSSFNKYIARLADEEEQLTINFKLMWDNHAFAHRAVGFGFGDTGLAGTLEITEPLDRLCRDADFTRRFGMTETFHESTRLRLERFITESEMFIDALNKERARAG